MHGDPYNVNLSTVAMRGPANGAGRLRPDWVVLGVPQLDGKVMVLASKTLTIAEMEVRYFEDEVEIQDFLVLSMVQPTVDPRCTLKAVMKDFHIFVADTYEQAFNALFQEWSADESRITPRSLPSAG